LTRDFPKRRSRSALSAVFLYLSFIKTALPSVAQNEVAGLPPQVESQEMKFDTLSHPLKISMSWYSITLTCVMDKIGLPVTGK
jgi:hypothetical protein